MSSTGNDGPEVNLTRALAFLHLTVEQLCNFDVDLADTIRTNHVLPLQDISNEFKAAKLRNLGQTYATVPQGMRALGSFNDLVKHKPAAPPGLGFDVLQEASSRTMTAEYGEAVQHTPAVPPGLGFDVSLGASSRAARAEHDANQAPRASYFGPNASNPMHNPMDRRMALDLPVSRFGMPVSSAQSSSGLSSRTGGLSISVAVPDFGVIGQGRPTSKLERDSTSKHVSAPMAARCKDSEEEKPRPISQLPSIPEFFPGDINPVSPPRALPASTTAAPALTWANIAAMTPR